MQRQTVQSSSIAAVGYDAANQTLEVQFHNGHAYRYEDVPASVHRELMDAESKGRFFNESIKDQYPFRQVK